MVRTFPEEVTITPENPDSSCKVSGQPVVAAAPTPPEGVTLAFANTVGFTVIDCDRNPNSSLPGDAGGDNRRRVRPSPLKVPSCTRSPMRVLGL